MARSETLKDEDAPYRPQPTAAAEEADNEMDLMMGKAREFKEEESRSDEDVRAAQALAGSLNWLATRTRADIAAAVSRMSSMASLAPTAAMTLGKRILRYLIATADVGLVMNGPNEDEEEEEEKLRIYCGASFAPNGASSYTGIAVLWRGSLLLWRAVRQSMVAQSTAEAELQAMAAGLQLGQALQEEMMELLGRQVKLHLFGDNQAAIA